MVSHKQYLFPTPLIPLVCIKKCQKFFICDRWKVICLFIWKQLLRCLLSTIKLLSFAEKLWPQYKKQKKLKTGVKWVYLDIWLDRLWFINVYERNEIIYLHGFRVLIAFIYHTLHLILLFIRKNIANKFCGFYMVHPLNSDDGYRM